MICLMRRIVAASIDLGNVPFFQAAKKIESLFN
jgi:hypothetical protein